MALAEDYIKFCVNYALENCLPDLLFFQNDYNNGEKGLIARLKNVIENDFATITYTDAITLLQTHIKEKKVKFKVYPSWGEFLYCLLIFCV